MVAGARLGDPACHTSGRDLRPGRVLIDLHCHALPGVDDGPATTADALALLRVAAAEGTHTVAATPHCSRRFPTSADTIAAEVSALRDAGCPVELLTGAEVTHEMALQLPDEELRRLTLGGSSCLLLETPLEPVVGPEFERSAEMLWERGYRILLAHPERAPAFREDPRRLFALIDAGALCSVTAAALAGGFGDAARWFGLELVRDGHAHSIDSDAHHATFRPPGLRQGLAAATAMVPSLRAAWFAEDVPAALLAGEPLPA
jgi:protein-tyrosine phosphatase